MGKVKPEKVMTPALPLLVIHKLHEPVAAAGAVMVKAPPLVMCWLGRAPQSGWTLPVLRAREVTFAPPLTVWSASVSEARVAALAGKVMALPAIWKVPETFKVPENVSVPVKVWVPRMAAVPVTAGKEKV